MNRILLILSFWLAILTPVKAAEAKWVKIETPGLVLYTDVSSRDAEKYALAFMAHDTAFRTFLAPNGYRSPRLVLVLFRRYADFSKYGEGTKVAGIRRISSSGSIDEEVLTAMSFEGEWNAKLSMAFESLTGVNLARAGYQLPLWIQQGTTEVFASLKLKGDKWWLGGKSDRFGPGGAWMDWDEFFTTSQSSPIYHGTWGKWPFHNQSWAVMHRVLLTPGGNMRSQLQALWSRVEASPTSVDALSEFWAEPVSDFNKNIRKHLKETLGNPLEVPFDMSATSASFKMSTVGDDEIKARYIDIMMTERLYAEADWMAYQLYAAYPKSPHALEVMSRLARRNNELLTAQKYMLDAIDAGSMRPESYLVAARDYLSQLGSNNTVYEGKGGAVCEQARKLVERALAADPTNSEAYALLGRVAYVTPKPDAELIDRLSAGIGDSLPGQMTKFYQATLFERTGKLYDAENAYRELRVAIFAPQYFRDEATRRLNGMIMSRVQSLVELSVSNDDFLGAHEAVAKERLTSPWLSEAFVKLDVWISEIELWKSMKQAEKLGDWVQLETLANSYLDKYPKSKRQNDVRELLQKALEKRAQAPAI